MVLTPTAEINRGATWAKANMLRVKLKAPTGWGISNSPTLSNNSVARDTAWFAMGTDYFMPEFSKEVIRHFLELQEPSGMIVEFYNMLDDKTEDFGMNINDNTPLILIALWHHHKTAGDEHFLPACYEAAAKAARYICSRRNERLSIVPRPRRHDRWQRGGKPDEHLQNMACRLTF